MSRMQHYVRLTLDQRAECERIVRRGAASALTQRRARILLHADRARPGLRRSDVAIADAVGVDARTVARVRAQYATAGFAAALGRRLHPTGPARKLDGAAEARLIQVACSAPPDGRAAWTLRLLAERIVALDIVDTISHETVRATLKKTSSNPG
jgi:hypothetical protein